MSELILSGPGAAQTIVAWQRKLVRNPGDCGIDLFPLVDAEHRITVKLLGAFAVMSVPTQLRVVVPSGTFAWITPRSSSVDRLQGCLVVPGIIDSGYTGEYRIRVQVSKSVVDQIVAVVEECSQQQVALAQFIVMPFHSLPFRMVDQATLEAIGGRGNRGYGSTDLKSNL